MTLAPLLHAPLAVKIHFATVVPAFLIGTWQIFFSTKGAPLHRTLGTIYLALMTTTAIAAIFIRQPSPTNPLGFTPIHVFVVVTLANVATTIWALRTHNIKWHRGSMLGLYVGGLLIAGALAFSPGRIMHAIVFGS